MPTSERPPRTPRSRLKLVESEPHVLAPAPDRVVFELGIDSFFGASHAMRPGGARHTHSFRVQATFHTDAVDDDGMVVGFREVNDLLDREARKYANAHINDLPPFDVIQPTGENIATAIYRSMAAAIRDIQHSPRLVSVTLWENPTSYVKVIAS